MDSTKMLYVGASFCPQCKVLRPKVEAYCANNDIEFVYVDAEDDERIVAKYGIRNLPTIIVFNGDEIVKRITGINGWNDYVG